MLALVVWPLTTHPLGDGARFLLLIERPLKLGEGAQTFVNLSASVQYIPSEPRQLGKPASRGDS